MRKHRAVTSLIGECAADTARRMGWKPGTSLIGDEGQGPTIIEITAIGERSVLAKAISHNGQDEPNPWETTWDFSCRDWKPVKA